ncbi:hypothetical protein [Devosia sp. XK-2]|uniref:hypothetical protein n=1 Tax=Devosia sp. XK-2 TaxID=3126689 RepID=UPI0030D05060
MPRRNRHPKRSGGARFWVQLEHWLLDTPAWRHLSANAKVIYVELKRRYNGKNNGEISLSAREAGDAIGASQQTGARALTELSTHGFVEVTEDSSFNRKVHVARRYRLTEVADDRPGLPRTASKDFLRWSGETAAKSKTQFHGCDATVSSMERHSTKKPTLAANSSTHGTVKVEKAISQFHGRNSIRYQPASPSKREAS